MRYAALLVSALFAAPAWGDFRFVHDTDTHVSSPLKEGSNAEKVAAMYREISRLDPRPAFVVNTGDYVEAGTPAEYAIHLKVLRENLSIPQHGAPGNHDVRWNPLGKEGYTLGSQQPMFHSWDFQNIHFVNLDSTVLLQHWGHISQEQLDWLKADLAKVGMNKPIIIGFHHWIGRDAVQVDNEQALMDLVAPYNVVLWLQGHGHADIEWNINGVPAIMARGLYQGSYHIIDVTADELRIQRRAVAKSRPGTELLQQEKDAPPALAGKTTPLMVVPLKKRPVPKWDAQARVTANEIELAVDRGDATGQVDYRIDSGKSISLDPNHLAAAIPVSDLTAGQHVLTVQMRLTDGRTFQKPLPINIIRPDAPKPAWDVNVHGAVQSRLVKDRDTLFVTTMAGDCISLTASTGKENWRAHVDAPIFSTPHIADGMVYFGSADHHIYAVDASTGSINWKYKTGGAVFAGASTAKGIVCIASVDKTIYGLDAHTGQRKWTAQGAGMFQSKAATDGDHFFIGGWDNFFRCIDATTGKELWKQKFGKSFYYAPAIASPAVNLDDHLVYVTSNDGILHAMKIADGEVAWEFDGKKVGYSSPLYHAGKIYTASGDQGVTYCFDARTGKQLWSRDVGAVIYDSSFAFGGTHVYIGSVNGTLSALDAETGKIDWQYALGPGHLLASPAADDHHVYIGNMAGRVVALPGKP